LRPAVAFQLLVKLQPRIQADDTLRASKEISDLIYMITTHLGPLEGANPPNSNELSSFEKFVFPLISFISARFFVFETTNSQSVDDVSL